MEVPYKIVIEKQEYNKYASVIDPKNILVLPREYQENYETCDRLGLSKPVGAGAARNFIWQHSIDNGYDWHWVMDDNIKKFFREDNNKFIECSDGTLFRCMEDFCGRYKNVVMAGPMYFIFGNRKAKKPPFMINTRIYSCNLIRNDIPFRWRGRYNEDTILSLDLLKAGYCTIQFITFQQDKAPTQTVKGGNTDTLYKGGTLEKSMMQVKVHPDVSKLVWKFNRWHHHVDYRRFKRNKLIKKEGLEINEKVNNYGMKLIDINA